LNLARVPATKVGSVAKRVKAPFLRRLWDHDRRDLGSTPNFGAQAVTFLNKALYDDYLGGFDKQIIKW